MKRIEKYVTIDGREFHTIEQAEKHEFLLGAIKQIEFLLPERPDGMDFTNGHGYIQHTKISIERARRVLYELACEEISVLSDYSLKDYGFSRYLSDGNSVLYNLYGRLIYCIDENLWREYGQGYFIDHPEEVEQICLNEY